MIRFNFNHGPWKFFYKHKYKEYHVSIPSEDGSSIALFPDGLKVGNYEKQIESNCRLIASAPDMLVALIDAFKIIRYHEQGRLKSAEFRYIQKIIEDASGLTIELAIEAVRAYILEADDL